MAVLRSPRFAYAFFVPLFFIWLLLFPKITFAADLTLSPASATVSVGSKVSIKVQIDPGTDSVNAADGTLSFDNSMLSVESISKDGSVFSLWTADPSFSNADGTITFSGGTPTAFTTAGKILTIVFKGKAVGSAKVAFSKGSILAADGKGTDVYKTGNPADITVTAATATPKPAATPAPAVQAAPDEADATGDGSPPVGPVISSPTYPKPDTWYGTSTAIFNWVLTSDVTAVRTLLSDLDNKTPTVTLKGGATTTQTVTGIKDGVSYFYVQAKNSFGWGDVTKFKMQIDTAPPLPFEIALQEPGTTGGLPKFTFKTDDQLSGLDHYELIVGTSTPISIPAKDITDGTYAIPPQAGGIQHVVVRAVDKAGNKMEVAKDLTLPFVAKPKTAAAVEEVPQVQQKSGFGLEEIVLILLALTLGGVIAWNSYSRKNGKHDKEGLLQAVVETRDKNDRIFSAMREEFEQLINNFDVKPQLTPEERDLLENIKEVLDLSEELIDTSMEELKKLVRNLTG